MEQTFKIEGRNPVIEAIKSGRSIDKIYVLKGESHGSVIKIKAMARDKRIPVVEIDKKKFSEMSDIASSQGVVANVSPVEYASVEDIIKRAEDKNEPLFVVLLDEIEDPHNLGAIIRTANAAGACFYTPVAKVTNLVQTIKQLKDYGVWFYGADMNGEKDVFETDFSGKIGIIIGNEGKGISPTVRKECDFMVNIPMLGEVESLNASVSAGIFMYSAVKSRKQER